jgi:hypothetical protein
MLDKKLKMSWIQTKRNTPLTRIYGNTAKANLGGMFVAVREKGSDLK